MNIMFGKLLSLVPGIGSKKALLLSKELNIHTIADLLQHYPFRYDDRTTFQKIGELGNLPDKANVQLIGKFGLPKILGTGRKKRLSVSFKDDTGSIDLVWFKGAQWILKKIISGKEFVVYGRATNYKGLINIAHPEFEIATPANTTSGFLQPVYPLTEKLRNNYLDNKQIGKLVKTILLMVGDSIPENLPGYMITDLKLMERKASLQQIHFPSSHAHLKSAIYRLKFEELFYNQFRLQKLKLSRKIESQGFVLSQTNLLNTFYHDHLPFQLTNAQKRVIKEVFVDFRSGKQMNRLMQGDVGSGKTIVAFICMLIAISNNTQAAMMAPTEILAYQHFEGLLPYVEKMGLKIAILTGSVKAKERRIIHEELASGTLHILVGTHALLEDNVKFKTLGLAVIDEQHRFGVAQRSKLWMKNKHTDAQLHPHILVMTATPIPRTLAMTLYGDLDVSVIDELPANRKPIKTTLNFERNRLSCFEFMRSQIKKGRQVYVVFPLIEESEKLDLLYLEQGLENLSRVFKEYHISVVHGRQKADVKAFEMQRFVKGETQIMIATTVIEVGVNVPNATVMLIENAERFGLAQLHQLRGRVGRGAEQSYCLLMAKNNLSKDSKERLITMVRTNNGFEISQKDLELRGPGDLTGTQQSGVADLQIANLATDSDILDLARRASRSVINRDINLENPSHAPIKAQTEAAQQNQSMNWSKIS